MCVCVCVSLSLSFSLLSALLLQRNQALRILAIDLTSIFNHNDSASSQTEYALDLDLDLAYSILETNCRDIPLTKPTFFRSPYTSTAHCLSVWVTRRRSIRVRAIFEIPGLFVDSTVLWLKHREGKQRSMQSQSQDVGRNNQFVFKFLKLIWPWPYLELEEHRPWDVPVSRQKSILSVFYI